MKRWQALTFLWLIFGLFVACGDGTPTSAVNSSTQSQPGPSVTSSPTTMYTTTQSIPNQLSRTTEAGEELITPYITEPPTKEFFCRNAEVKVDITLQSQNAEVEGNLGFTNTSNRTCGLPVFTTGLTIVDHTGHPIYPALDCTECTIDLAYAYYSVYAARPGTRFSFNFIWRNWCDAAPAEPLMIYTSLSEGSLFSLPFDVKLPACTQNDKPSRLASYRLKPDQTRPVGQVYEATAQTFPPLTPTFSPILHYCEANELTANAKFYPDSMSVQYFQLTFINKGKTTCYLQGHPDVQLLDKSKHIMTVDRETTPDTTRSNGRLIAVLPGKAGYLYITWGNWCPLDSPGVDSIRVSLPGRNEAMNVNFVKDPNRAAPIYGPRCIMPDKGSAISVGPFDDEPYFKDN